MTTRVNSQFPRPDFHRQDKQPYGLRATARERLPRNTKNQSLTKGFPERKPRETTRGAEEPIKVFYAFPSAPPRLAVKAQLNNHDSSNHPA